MIRLGQCIHSDLDFWLGSGPGGHEARLAR